MLARVDAVRAGVPGRREGYFTKRSGGPVEIKYMHEINSITSDTVEKHH